MLAHAGAEHLFTAVAAVVAIAAYGWCWVSLRHPSRGELACWIGGVAAAALATMPTIEGVAERSFTGHMAQHLILICVAAPLLVLGRPLVTVERAGLLTHSRMIRHGRARLARRARWLTLAGPGGLVLVLVATHFTGLYDAAIRHRVVHDLEHLAYLGAAAAAWTAILSRRRSTAMARLAAVLAVGAGGAFVGMVLLSAKRPLVASYVDRLGPTAALADQHRAAALMWVGGMVATVPLLVAAVWRWASTEQRIAERAERLADGGLSR